MQRTHITLWIRKRGLLIASKHALTFEEVVKGIKMRHYTLNFCMWLHYMAKGFPIQWASGNLWNGSQHIGIFISGTRRYCRARAPFNSFCGNIQHSILNNIKSNWTQNAKMYVLRQSGAANLSTCWHQQAQQLATTLANRHGPQYWERESQEKE